MSVAARAPSQSSHLSLSLRQSNTNISPVRVTETEQHQHLVQVRGTAAGQHLAHTPVRVAAIQLPTETFKVFVTFTVKQYQTFCRSLGSL